MGGFNFRSSSQTTSKRGTFLGSKLEHKNSKLSDKLVDIDKLNNTFSKKHEILSNKNSIEGIAMQQIIDGDAVQTATLPK